MHLAREAMERRVWATPHRWRRVLMVSFCAVLSPLSIGCSEDPTLDRVGGGRSPPDVPEGQDAAVDAGCPPGVPEGELPCDVAQVLASRCQRCHSRPEVTAACEASGGCVAAPFPLETIADVHAEYFGRPIRDRMHAAIETGFMPFREVPVDPPVEPLGEDEKTLLLTWLEACAPAGTGSCAP